MPTKKIISDQYTIRAPEVIIDGNLIVGGSATSTTVQNTSIQDKTILLNQGEQGVGITGVDKFSGIEIERGSLNNVGLRFNEDPAGDGSVLPSWQVTDDGSAWKYILTGSSATSTGLTEVADDTSPTLGGNLELDGFSILQTTSNVELFFSSVSSGGSGVFVNNDIGPAQELIVKKKAIIYALIF